MATRILILGAGNQGLIVAGILAKLRLKPPRGRVWPERLRFASRFVCYGPLRGPATSPKGEQPCLIRHDVGLGRCLVAARERDDIEIVGFVDDNPRLDGSTVLGVRILGTLAQVSHIPHDAIVVAIGDNRRREALSLEFERRGAHLFTACHPDASVAADVEVGPGSMISAGAVVTPGARIGRGVLLNTSCSVDHQTIVGDFAHVGSGATVGGNVTIGARTMIGLGATVVSGRRIGADTVIGAGAVVVRDIPDGVVAFGVPARVQRPNV